MSENNILNQYSPHWEENRRRLGCTHDPHIRAHLGHDGYVTVIEEVSNVVVGVLPAALEVIPGVLPTDLDSGHIIDLADSDVMLDVTAYSLWVLLAWYYLVGDKYSYADSDEEPPETKPLLSIVN